MTFSKSFGYAVRGVLYIAMMQDEKRYVQVEEIATRLSVPRHFMGKILKKLAKRNVLLSVKGPSGGFTVNEVTLQLSLLNLIDITDSLNFFKTCVLNLKECSAENPCPMHYQIEPVNRELMTILSNTTIADLLNNNKTELVDSISTALGREIFFKKDSKEKNY